MICKLDALFWLFLSVAWDYERKIVCYGRTYFNFYPDGIIIAEIIGMHDDTSEDNHGKKIFHNWNGY